MDLFIPVVVASKQITAEEITTFIDNAHEIFADTERRDNRIAEHGEEKFNRWAVQIRGGGEVTIFRTKNSDEFLAAWDGVLEVLQALKDGKDLPGIKILVRGTRRFFDIKGIGGVGGRTWIAFDLR